MTSLDDYSTIKRWAQSGQSLFITYDTENWWIVNDECVRAVHPVLLQAIRTALSNIDKGLDYEGNKLQAP